MQGLHHLSLDAIVLAIFLERVELDARTYRGCRRLHRRVLPDQDQVLQKVRDTQRVGMPERRV